MGIGQSFSTAVCKQKQVIFNQKLINQLALLTGGGALQPHTHTYMCMLKKTNDIDNCLICTNSGCIKYVY